jgi:hypothetical protein
VWKKEIATADRERSVLAAYSLKKGAVYLLNQNNIFTNDHKFVPTEFTYLHLSENGELIAKKKCL